MSLLLRSVQPKAQELWRFVFVFVCRLSQSHKVEKADYEPNLCCCKCLLRKQSSACCTSFAGLHSRACSTDNSLTFCKNTAAGSTLLLRKNWILGKQAGLFCQTAEAFQGLLVYSLCELHSSKVGTLSEAACLGQSNTPVNALRQALQAFSGASNTSFVHTVL